MLLEVEGLSVSFETADGTVRAVRDMSFSVAEGKTLGIVGESGSGKSVSMHALLGLTGGTTRGTARLNGVDLLSMRPKELQAVRGAKAAMIFQDPLTSLHPLFRVGAQIGEAIGVHEKLSHTATRRRTMELMDQVGIPQADKWIDAFPHQLSGGMRQRIMIAIAISARPHLLIADEPTTALDVTVQAGVLDLLRGLQRENGMGLILITHDLGVVSSMAHDIITMYGGAPVERGTRDDLIVSPHHPYTQGLLDSLPSFGQPVRRLTPIPGQPPSLLAQLPGCAFADRCGLAQDRCTAEPLPVQLLSPTHQSRCILGPEHSDRLVITDHEPMMPTVFAEGRESLVSISQVTVEYGKAKRTRRASAGHIAANDVSFEIFDGEVLGIVGESGSGKSTVARVAAGLLAPTSGRVEFRGTALSDLDSSARSEFRRNVQVVFQDPMGSLNPYRRVGSIIAEPLVVHGYAESKIKTRVQELMEVTGLNPEYYNRFPTEFSGGQRQRISIARAIALKPRLIICDEPVSALDVSIQAQILNLLKDLRDAFGLAYLFISHDLAIVENIADRVLVMKSGSVVEQGQAATIFTNPGDEYTKNLIRAIPTIHRGQGTAA